jgi:hypothetical protein
MMRSYTVQLKATPRRQDTRLVCCCPISASSTMPPCRSAAGDAWKTCRKRIGNYEQQAELTQLRAVDPESASFPVAIQRDPLRRVRRRILPPCEGQAGAGLSALPLAAAL